MNEQYEPRHPCENASAAPFTPMSRFTFFADIAGQVSRDARGSDRVTAAAVAVPTADIESLRLYVDGMSKWRDCTLEDAESMVVNLKRHTSAVAIVSITKEPDTWNLFWESAKPLHEAIVLQERTPAGFIKPANAVKFFVLGEAVAIALGHAARISSRSGIVDYCSRELIERTIVCDTDIQGDENISVFKNFWKQSDLHQPRIEKLGFRFVTRDVVVATEQQEPLLLLADYAAGIAHSALIPNSGRISLPVPHEPSKRLLSALDASGKLVVVAKPFDLKYEDMFGDALAEAARQKETRRDAPHFS